MKKLVVFILSLVIGALNLSALDVGDLKNAKKKAEATNKKASAANDQAMNDLNTKLKNLQNEKGPIVFKTGKAVIDVDKCKDTLDTLALIVKGYKMFRVQIEGHTDNVGSAKVNLNLSQKRAQAVVSWLTKYGKVSAKQLRAKGFGSKKPIADNKTEAGREKNRRVDFSVSKLY